MDFYNEYVRYSISKKQMLKKILFKKNNKQLIISDINELKIFTQCNHKNGKIVSNNNLFIIDGIYLVSSLDYNFEKKKIFKIK